MKNRRNYYRILQVQPDAPVEVIRSSYRTMMRELKQHPDLGGSTSDASVLNEAYETLSNPDRRAAYDKTLFLRYPKQAGAPGRQPPATPCCPICGLPLARRPQPGDSCPTCRTPLQSKKPACLDQESRRSLARMKSDDRVFYYTTWPGKVQQGRMIDFSPEGMRFLCPDKLQPKTVLKISSRLFEASGAVTNMREEQVHGRQLYAVGICFLAISFEEPTGTFLSTSA
jgi:hypothetical protein